MSGLKLDYGVVRRQRQAFSAHPVATRTKPNERAFPFYGIRIIRIFFKYEFWNDSRYRPLGRERRGKRKRSTLFLEKTRETNTGTVSEATMGKRPRDEVERIWVFLSAQTPYWTARSWFFLKCTNEPLTKLFEDILTKKVTKTFWDASINTQMYTKTDHYRRSHIIVYTWPKRYRSPYCYNVWFCSIFEQTHNILAFTIYQCRLKWHNSWSLFIRTRNENRATK